MLLLCPHLKIYIYKEKGEVFKMGDLDRKLKENSRKDR